MKSDPRVAAYIAKAKPFAQPILVESRKRVLQACPDAEETIKWNVPFYLSNGKIIASMAAFKQHVKVGVWAEMKPSFVDVSDVSELPPAKDFAAQVKSAVQLAAAAAPTKKTAAKEAPAKKAVAKKAPAAKKTATKKAPAKKAPAKKKA